MAGGEVPLKGVVNESTTLCKPKFEVTFAKQFRAVFLKNVSEEVRQRKLLVCQIIFPVVLIAICLIVELTIGAMPDETSDRNSVYRDRLLPWGGGYSPYLIAREPGDAGAALIGSAPNGTAPCNSTSGVGLLGFVRQRFELTNIHYEKAYGGCSPNFEEQPSWTVAESVFKSRVKRKLAAGRKYPSDPQDDLDRLNAPVAVLSFPRISTSPRDLALSFTLFWNDEVNYGKQETQSLLVDEAFLRFAINYSMPPGDVNRTVHPFLRINSAVAMFDMFNAYAFFSPKTADLQVQMFLLVFALMCQIPFFMYKQVLERQSGLLEMIEMMGLRLSTYVVSNFLHDLILYFVVLAAIFIAAFSGGLKLITMSWMVPVLLILWGPSQVSVSYFLSCFFLVGFIFVLVVIGIGFGLTWGIFYGDTTAPAYFLFFPPLALIFGVFCAARFIGNPSYILFFSKSMAEARVGVSIAYIVGFGIVFLLLSVYLDPILPKKVGQSRPVHWPLKVLAKAFQGRNQRAHKKITLEESPSPSLQMVADDEDCRAEVAAVHDEQVRRDSAIVIEDISKTFGSNLVGTSVKALQGVSFHVEKGTCFGLLGPNGAGKTTLVNVLCGLLKPDSGHAFIEGVDVTKDVSEVRKNLGLCPQFDIHCDDLTVREHLLFYSRLKGCPRKYESNHVESIIKDVGLLTERRRLASNLSGGQKRRLSLAIALTGNPPVVFLDEPTSSLDPGATREMWDIILAARASRCFMMTTHSMTEADTICGRIGIISRGKLRCIGDSQRLKSKYGQGYKADVFCREERQPEVEAFFMKLAPGAQLVNKTHNALVFRIPKEVVLSELFSLVEAEKYRHGIQSWSVTQSSLDEVFLSIVRSDEIGTGDAEAPPAASTVAQP